MKIICPICLNTLSKNNCKLYKTTCKFTNRQIIRYQCNKCDVIFGPIDFIVGDKQNLSNQYSKIFLSGYEGFNSSGKEINLFKKMAPQKSKIYLNWGCGQYDGTFLFADNNKLNIYGYDPFIIKKPTHKNFTDDLKTIRNLRFDGIFSNDLIEHLQDPISEFKLMFSLLKDDGIMMHQTPCYEYLFEWSQFHLYFFVGKSVGILSKNSGFTVHNTNNKHIKSFKKVKNV